MTSLSLSKAIFFKLKKAGWRGPGSCPAQSSSALLFSAPFRQLFLLLPAPPLPGRPPTPHPPPLPSPTRKEAAVGWEARPRRSGFWALTYLQLGKIIPHRATLVHKNHLGFPPCKKHTSAFIFPVLGLSRARKGYVGAKFKHFRSSTFRHHLFPKSSTKVQRQK